MLEGQEPPPPAHAGPGQPYWLEGQRVPLRAAVAALLEDWPYPKALALEDEDDDFCGWNKSGAPSEDAVARTTSSERRPYPRSREEAVQQEKLCLDALLSRCVREGACTSAQSDLLAEQYAQGICSLEEILDYCKDLLSGVSIPWERKRLDLDVCT